MAGAEWRMPRTCGECAHLMWSQGEHRSPDGRRWKVTETVCGQSFERALFGDPACPLFEEREEGKE